ncbi:MAG: Fe-S cluster assembly protein SufD [Holophagales bacterium]|jgi:Fe-S cluster assembly protein SufD|nr:Fe-S cluster assembly protein SufD [Holophagales bacterium]
MGKPFLQSIMSLPLPLGWDALRKQADKVIKTALPHPPCSGDWQKDWEHLPGGAEHKAEPKRISGTIEPPHRWQFSPPETAHSRLLFTNGDLNHDYSDTSAVGGGCHFLPLNEASTALPEIVGKIGELTSPSKSDWFANLNNAHFSGGAVIYVPSGMQLENPLHVIFESLGRGSREEAQLPRLLIVLEPGAKAHVVEEYWSVHRSCTSAVCEIFLGEGSSLRHDIIQQEGESAFHFRSMKAEIAKSASLSSTILSFGAAKSRYDIEATLAEESAELELNGLAMATTDECTEWAQTSETHSLIDHAVPSCTSRQLQKMVLDGSSKGFFHGKILVRSKAQGTDANQSSRNLLLSDKATIDARPQLEILADDVKCGHGATVGQLDENELFYLQSRGIDPALAKNMLLVGFAAEIINRVGPPSLRNRLIERVIRKGLF